MMRLLNGLFAILFGFLAMRYVGGDEPGGIMLLLLALGTLWTALGAIVPVGLALRPVSMMLSLTMASAILACLYFWPEHGAWWMPDVWMTDADAQRSVTLMTLVLGMLAPVSTSVRISRERDRAERAAKEAAIEERRTSALAGRS